MADYYFKKGLLDGRSYNYDPPSGSLNSAERRAYEEGYWYGKGQYDQSNGRGYNPPSNSDDKDQYDLGYDSYKRG